MTPRWGRAASALALGTGPLAGAVVRLGFGWRPAIEIVVAAIVVGGLLLAGRRVIALVAAGCHVALLWQWTRDPEAVTYVSVMLPMAAAMATGAVPLEIARPRPGRARPVGLLTLIVVVIDVMLVARPAIAPTAIGLTPAIWVLVLANAAPPLWRPVERWTEPLTRRVAGLDRITDAIRGIARWVATILAVPATALAWVAVVLVPWAAQRAVRNDPLRAPVASRRSRWITREAVDGPQPRQMWFDDPAPRRVVAAMRFRSGLVWLIAVSIVGGLWSIPRVRTGITGRIDTQLARIDAKLDEWFPDAAPGPAPAPTPPTTAPLVDAAAALTRQPWFRSWEDTYDVMLRDAVITQYGATILPDATSRYMNFTNGIRRSWTPPATSCTPKITVWMFGGSTLFGLGQRDRFTIPSELARRAWKSGVALEVENHGVPGDLSWIEQRRLEQEFATRTDRPDIVVFYDGYNDKRSVEWVSMTGRGVRGRFWALGDRDLFPLVRRFSEVTEDGVRRYVAPPIDVNKYPEGDFDSIVEGTAFQFRTWNATTRRTLDDARIPFVSYFQPWVSTRTPAVEGDFPDSEIDRARVEELRQKLPPGVIDISTVLDDTTEPFFTDDIHTNEGPNPTIAARMWRDVRQTAEPLANQRKDPACS